MAGDVVVVQPVVGDQLMHQAQREGGIGAGQQGDVLVAFFGRLGAARVYADDACAIAFGGLHVAPEVHIAGNRVAAPDQDELGLRKKLHLGADLVAQSEGQCFSTR